jgi:hypothetical protein
MSRLDSHIHQKIAQRDSIDLAARWLRTVPGVVVEFGLGSGRSYAHLRERLPDRQIFCFDRRPLEHPHAPRPAAEHLILGELTRTLDEPAIHRRFVGRVALAHLDLGWGGPEDETVPEYVLSRIHPWLVSGAAVLCDQDLTLEPSWRLRPVDTSREVQHAERYFVYRRLLD